MDEWEKRAQAVLIDPSKSTLDDDDPQYSTIVDLTQLLAEGSDIEAALPSYHTLQTAVTHAKDWLNKVCSSSLRIFLWPRP